MKSSNINPIRAIIASLFAFTNLHMAEAAGGNGADADAKKKFCDKDWDSETGIVFFNFGNGKSLEFDTNKLTVEMQKELMFHGASQKIGDSYAGKSKTNDYAGAISAAQGVMDQLYAGDWRSAPGEGEGRPRLAELAEAIARLKNAPVEKAMAAVEAATDDQRKTWRTNPEVKHAIQAIRLEKAQKQLEEARASGGGSIEVQFS